MDNEVKLDQAVAWEPEVSIVIPVYNSAQSISELISRLSATLAEQRLSFELILVDDCSGDDSRAVIRALATGDERIILIARDHNAGLLK